jgi:hypothetical protein
MTLVEAAQLLLTDWYRRRSETFSPSKPVDLLTHVNARAAGGYEPARRLLRAEDLPPADVRPRPIGERRGSGGPDVDLLEYVEGMLDSHWDEDCDYADSAIDIESYWRSQNRLRRLFGLPELGEKDLRSQLEQLDAP